MTTQLERDPSDGAEGLHCVSPHGAYGVACGLARALARVMYCSRRLRRAVRFPAQPAGGASGEAAVLADEVAAGEVVELPRSFSAATRNDLGFEMAAFDLRARCSQYSTLGVHSRACCALATSSTR